MLWNISNLKGHKDGLKSDLKNLTYTEEAATVPIPAHIKAMISSELEALPPFIRANVHGFSQEVGGSGGLSKSRRIIQIEIEYLKD